MMLLLKILLSAGFCLGLDAPSTFISTSDLDWEAQSSFYPYRNYHSIVDTSPAIRLGGESSSACHDGLYNFLTPRGYSVPDPLATIVDDHGEIVWMNRTMGQAYDLKVQEVGGHQYLSYWTGDDKVRGHGSGEWILLDRSYTERHRIQAMGGLAADLHELVITPQGTALITMYETTETNVTSSDGAKGFEQIFIWDCLFQEVDFINNKLLFQWRASDHYTLDDSFHDRALTGSDENPFDWFHINSVQKDDLGNFLVSARYTHSVTYIDGRTGEVMWILGGKRNYFTDLSGGNATNFSWQHDARIRPLEAFPTTMHHSISRQASLPPKTKTKFTTNLLTLFDNGAEDLIQDRDHSRGLLLELQYPTPSTPPSTRRKITTAAVARTPSRSHTARLVRSYRHPDSILSSSQGSMQLVPAAIASPSLSTNVTNSTAIAPADPNVLIGYGFNAVHTLYSATGEVLCDTRFAPRASWETGQVQSYRAFKGKWVGLPLTKPDVAVGRPQQKVWVSWNGATEVRAWRVEKSLGRAGYERWRGVVVAPKLGFETELDLGSEFVGRYVRVVGLDGMGRVLGVSDPVDLGSGFLVKSAAMLAVRYYAELPLWIRVGLLPFLFGFCTRPFLTAVVVKYRDRQKAKARRSGLTENDAQAAKQCLIGESDDEKV